MAKVDLLNNVLASGDKAQWQKTAQSKKALVEAARGDRDISTLRPVLSVQKPSTTSASDTSWMQNIFTQPGQSRGRTAPSAPAVAPIQTPELDASVGNTPGTGTMSADYLSVTGQDFGQATDKAPPAAQTPSLAAWLKNRFSQGVAENRLGQDGAAAEMAGQSEGPAYTGDPEDVARQEWARYGVDNARDYNAAVDYEQRYVGRRAAQSAMDSVRNSANDVGYRAQAGAGRAAAEDAYWADVMTGTVPAEDYGKYQEIEQANTVTEFKDASHLGEAYAQKTAEMFPEVTAEMQQLGDLASGITGMAPQIVMGAASLALGNAAPALSALLKVSGSAALFSSASGGAAKDALLNGAKPEDALRYGTVVGMVELATEKIANGLGLFGKAAGLGGVTDDLVEGIIKKYVNDTAAQKAFLYVAGMLGEGFEEWVSEYADYFANKKMPGIGYDTRTIQEVGADARYSFAIGSLISAVMQTSNVLQGRRNVTAEDVKAELDNAVRAQEAPGDAFAPGSVVTAPTAPNAPTQVLNPGTGETSAAPAVVPNVTAETPAATVPNSAPANPTVQSAAPGSFDAMLQQSPGVHPVNAEGAANAQLYQNRGVTQVPTQNFQGHLTSKTASTIMNAGITPTELVTQMQEAMARGAFSRIAYTDAAAQANAEAHIADVGWDVALAEYKADTRAGKSSKDITTLGTVLYNNALTNGDMLTAMDIVSQMIQNRKSTAQSLQATNMLNKATPDGRLYMAMRSIDNIREQIIQKYGDKAPDLQIDSVLMQEYYDALKSGDKEAEKSAWHNIQQNIADQVPSTWKDKLNAWRYLSMLGNPRTHIRNIVGNAGFVPVRAMKNIIATSIESAFSVDGRTKAFLNYASSADRALVNLAASDFKNMEEYIQSGGKYVDTNSSIEDMRTIFGFKPLEWIRKINTAGLNKEDVLFSKPIYASALASYWKANGITAQDITSGNVSAEVMSSAQLYAAKEAAKATYRDSNWFSDYVSKLGKNYQGKNPIAKAANVLVEGVIPFKRTPANILARAVEYSPAGLVKGIYDMTVNIKSGKVTAAEAIDTFSAGLTGTGLMALGALLAAHGLVSGSADDDEKQSAFDKLRGRQNYSITIGNKNYTLDWLAPEALPFFVGVEIFNHFIDNGASKNWQEFTESLTGITEPLLETSMLSSLEELFSSIKYADGDYLGIAAKTAATSYLSQFIPTIFGQVERAFTENQREETYRYGDSNILNSSGQYDLGKILNKVPGKDYHQIPYIDAWGRTQSTGSVAGRIANNFLNPAYVSNDRSTAVDSELQRLYDAGFTGVLPQKPSQSMKIDGAHLTQEEYVAYCTTQGQTALSTVSEIMSGRSWDTWSDKEKSKAIEYAYEIASSTAKEELHSGRGTDADTSKWVSGAIASGNPSAYIEAKMYAAKLGDSGQSAAANAADFAEWADTHFSPSVASDLKNNITFSSGFIQTAEKYSGLTASGLTPQNAGKVYDAVSALTPADGYESVAAWQKYEAIASSGLSADDIDAAMSNYMPHGEDGKKSTYEKYMDARAQGFKPNHIIAFYQANSTIKKSGNTSRRQNVMSWAREYGFSDKWARYLYDLFN